VKVALLGYEQSGKKTFFSLLTGKSLESLANRKEGESVEGIAPIRDPRVDALTALYQPERMKYAENNIVLCPNVLEGGKRDWLEAARKCDLLCMVVRAFTSDQVYHPKGVVDAPRDRTALESELLLADLELIEKRLDRLAREKKSGQTNQQALEEKVLTRLKETIETEMRVLHIRLDPQELEPIQSLNLLMLKPVVWAYNVDEGALASGGAGISEEAFRVSCLIEREIMALDTQEERIAYLKDLGVSVSGLDRLNQATYDASGLMSFYTSGKDEVRAWTIRKGSQAPTAGGKVHSDIERGFIRVEVMKCEDLLAAGSEAALKAQGKIYVKGRDYVIEDGDICHFRFNV